jgi:hypothetical protein
MKRLLLRKKLFFVIVTTIYPISINFQLIGSIFQPSVAS